MGSHRQRRHWAGHIQIVMIKLPVHSIYQIVLISLMMVATIHSQEGMEVEAVQENMISSRDFNGILCGVLGFWLCFFVMGAVYLLSVLAKRVFKPEEAEKSPA